MESNNVFAVSPPDTEEAIGNSMSHCGHSWIPVTKKKVVPFPNGLKAMVVDNHPIILKSMPGSSNH